MLRCADASLIFVTFFTARFEATTSLMSPNKIDDVGKWNFTGVIRVQGVCFPFVYSAQVLAAAKTAFIAKFVVTTGQVGRTRARVYTYIHTCI